MYNMTCLQSFQPAHHWYLRSEQQEWHVCAATVLCPPVSTHLKQQHWRHAGSEAPFFCQRTNNVVSYAIYAGYPCPGLQLLSPALMCCKCCVQHWPSKECNCCCQGLQRPEQAGGIQLQAKQLSRGRKVSCCGAFRQFCSHLQQQYLAR